jgi:hypothetical protein
MKLILRIVLIGALTYVFSPFSFWWMNMLGAFIVCFILPSSGIIAFIASFLGGGLVWLGQAWRLDVANSSRFSSMIVELFPVDDPFYLILASGIIGGITAGFAGVSGTFFRGLFIKKPIKTGYYD